MQYALDEPEIPINGTPKFREIGICVLDGEGGGIGESNILITFCPWCGGKLPASMRNEWFEELERRGIDPYGDKIPTEFLSEKWYESNQK
jgi:hypothetical protein